MENAAIGNSVESGGARPTLIRQNPMRPESEIERSRLGVPDSVCSGQVGLAAFLAPAGYGKSTAMALWQDHLQAREQECCWLALRDKHRDPKALLLDLLQALREQLPAIDCSQTESHLRTATSYLIEPVMASLAYEIEAVGRRIFLFLDDLENLSTAAGRDIVALLIEHRPANLTLVLGSRDIRQFALSRYRLAGKIVEFGIKDLQFNAGEIRELLSQRFDIELPDTALLALARKTEGWPAALSLYAMGVNARGQTGTVIEDFVGASSELTDYLGEVLFTSLDEELQAFLLRAAVPEQFNADLLRHLVAEPDEVGRMLQQILDANLFLQRVDINTGEFRFHALCADFMRRRLKLENQTLYQDLISRTAEWCWSQGRIHEAIECARRAGEWDFMAQRMLECADEVVRSSAEFESFLAWTQALPDEVLNRYPELLLHQSWALGFSRKMPEAEAVLLRLQTLLPDLPAARAQDLERQLKMHNFVIAAIMDRAQDQIDEIRQWLDRYPDASDAERGQVLSTLSPAARNSNLLDQSLPPLEQAEECFRRCGADYSLSWVHNIRIAVLIKRGDFAAARLAGQRGLEEMSQALGEHSPPSGMSNCMLAYLAYEAGDLSAARAHIDSGLHAILDQGMVDSLYFAYLTQSYLAAEDGNLELAVSSLSDGESLGLSFGLPRLTTQLATRRVLRYLHADDQLAADAVIQARQLLDYPKDAFTRDRDNCADLIRAHQDLLRGKHAAAQERLKAMSKCAAQDGRMRMKAEYDFLLAIAVHAAGDANDAGRRFRQLLAEAAVQQRYRFMLHVGALGRGLIAEQLQVRQQAWSAGVEKDAADGILGELAQVLGLLDEEEGVASVDTAVEALTRREIDILKRAASSGLNNKKLAQALFVSEGTLKWHLHNIYNKLGTRNRAGAIAQAQRLGLLR